MHLDIKITALAKEVLDDLVAHGGKVYFVGGCVRDRLLNRDYKDIDVEVHHLQYEELIEILSKHGHVHTFGASFAVVHLDELKDYEFALPRTETKIGERHQDFLVHVRPDLDLKLACARRDFTINAMMCDYETGEVHDFYGGLTDLKNGILREVNPKHFGEDPLRILRAATFISRYMLRPASSLEKLCRQMCEVHSLESLSTERIYDEYSRILMGTQPSLGLNFIKNVHGLPKYLEDLVHTIQRADFHPEGSVWNHTLLVVDLCANVKEETSWPLAFMWSALLHDIGKPKVTTPEGHAYNHHLAGVEVFKDVESIQDKKMRRYVSMMIKQHMTLMVLAKGSCPIKYLRLLKEIDGIVPLNDLIWISRCDKMGRGYIASRQIEAFNEWINAMIETYGDHAPAPLVTGKDLIEAQITDHKRYKELLDQAYEWQLEGLNKEQIIRRVKRER